MPNYTKLFNSIVTSTIWTEDDKTRIVWITMLALADQNGEVHSSIPGLARLSAVPIADVERALEKFVSPDAYSRTPDNEGRRIAKIDGGWELLNHAKYRKMASKEDSKAASAERVRRHRARNADVTECNGDVTPCNAPVTVGRDIAEAESDTKEKKERKSLRNQSATLSDESKGFAKWFYDLLEDDKKPTGNWKESFAKTYDELTRIDKLTKDEIKDVCLFGTEDDFWKKNFARPGYLRKRSRTTGLTHYVQIKNAMIEAQKPTGKPPANLVTVKL